MTSLIKTSADEAVAGAETSSAERHAILDRLDREAESLRTGTARYEATIGAVLADLRARGGEWHEIAKATHQSWRQVERDERRDRWEPGLKSIRTVLTSCEPPADPGALPVLETDSLEAQITRLDLQANELAATETSIESQRRSLEDAVLTLLKSCQELLHE